MAKYKVGDRVVVREDLHYGRYNMISTGGYNTAIDEMLCMAGRVVTIVSDEFANSSGYRIKEFSCGWTDEMFAGLESEVLTNSTPVEDLL